MSELQDLQSNFQNYILVDAPNVIAQIQGIRTLSAKQRADCYKLDYELRLIEIMGKDFPYLREYMGLESFTELSKAYIKAYPSNHFNIIYFDRFFTEFLRDYPQIGQVHRDLARFEWEISTTLFARDGNHCTIEDLAAISPESWGEMKIEFHPSARTFDLMSNAPAIWTAYQKMETPPDAATVDQPQTWMMWRFNQSAYFIHLPQNRAWMYGAICDGKNFGQICEELGSLMQANEEEVAQFAVLSLHDWFIEGAISSVWI